MPRRFAIVLLLLLVLLLVGLVVALRLAPRGPAERPAATRTNPTPRVPPTPIPPRRVTLYFESAADEKLHPEARDLASARDDGALVAAVAGAVLEGPRRADLLKPFPDGWQVRAAYRLKDGIAVLDLAPAARPEPTSSGAAPAAWEAGSHEEWNAVQALVLSVTRNVPGLSRVVLLVGGEPVETLGGHVDLSHPILVDPGLAVIEPPGEPPPTPTATPPATATPTPSPTLTPRPIRKPAPRAPRVEAA